MEYINTTFAHGNGPYSRCVEWAIEVNNVREERKLERLPIVVPNVYGERQKKIMKEEIEGHISDTFFEEHPDEIWFDSVQGNLLMSLMFNSSDYSENLETLALEYGNVENKMKRHLDGERRLECFVNLEIRNFDMRNCKLQLGLNNRIQTGLPNQFYVSGGAGPFDEVLERAVEDDKININRNVVTKILPIARRMIENQKIIFSNEPGVFSYDDNRLARDNEEGTPPFIHSPKYDDTPLTKKGIYFLATGIDGIRESGIYDTISEFGLQVYVAKFSMNGLPDSVRLEAIELAPSKINNPNIVAQYARAGWSEVWLSHLTGKGFLTSPYQDKDDPEIKFNNKGIEKYGLGVIVGKNPKEDLDKAIKLASKVGEYNRSLLTRYGTLDGIRYAAERVVNVLD